MNTLNKTGNELVQRHPMDQTLLWNQEKANDV